MVIQSNIAAANATRILGKTNELRSASSGKLSSGLRIRTAADDSAGVAISEKMRGQIRGLSQASRNSQDAISLVQTAEGGMSVASDIVGRMRELAVYGASDVCEESDRANIQEEIDQLLKELDTLSKDTKFNDMTLLDGSLGKGGDLTQTHQDILKYLKNPWITESLSLIHDQLGLSFPNDVNLEVQYKEREGALATMGTILGSDNYVLTINPAYLDDSKAVDANGDLYWGGETLERVIAHEMTHAIMFANTPYVGSIPNWFVEGLASAVEGASDVRLGGMSNAQLTTLMDRFSVTTSGDMSYTAGYMAVMYMDHAGTGGTGGKIAQLMNELKTQPFDAAVQTVYGMNTADLVTQIKNAAASNMTQFLSDSNIDLTTPSMLKGMSVSAPFDVLPNGTPATDYADGDVIQAPDPPNSNITLDWPESLFGHPLYFQVGANSGDIMKVDIGGITASGLGIKDISVMDHFSAEDALGKLDTAVSKITSMRGQLGAYQNRLEYKTGNLDISGENLTAAESRIRDLDMAKEMVNFTKANILSQSGTAALASANQRVETVLQLLG